MKVTKEQLITAGFRFVEQQERWPVYKDFPAHVWDCRKLFGSWAIYKRELRDAWIRTNGVPTWDDLRPSVRTRNDLLRQEVGDVVEGSIERLNAFTPLRPRVPKHNASKDDAELHVVISDVHVGEKNDPEMMANLTGPDGYSYQVFLNAADRLEERLLFFRNLYSKAWNLKKLVVNFIGDIVTGENLFQGQALQIDRIITDQITSAAHRFASMFRNWARYFEEVEIICLYGNHGRIGKPGELDPRSNFDYITYVIVDALLRDVANTKILIFRGQTAIVQHGTYNFLVHHGHTVRGAGGTKGNFIGLERKARAFSAMGGIPIHFTISGHMHRSASLQMAGGGRIIQNGSFPGGSEFSIEVLGDCQVPYQKMFVFGHKGIYAETDLILGESHPLVPDSNRVLSGNYIRTH